MSFNLKTNDEFKVAAVVVRRFSVVLFFQWNNVVFVACCRLPDCLNARLPPVPADDWFRHLFLIFFNHCHYSFVAMSEQKVAAAAQCVHNSLSPLLISFSFVTVELLCCRIVCLSISFVVCRNYRFIWLSNCPTATRRCTHILFPIVVVFILSLWCRCVLSSHHHRSLSLAI